jgi:hypothetical protein
MKLKPPCATGTMMKTAEASATETTVQESRETIAAMMAALGEFNRRTGREEIGERDAAAQATHDLRAKAISFYRDQGLVETRGVLPRNTPPACAALPTGPFIDLTFAGTSIE